VRGKFVHLIWGDCPASAGGKRLRSRRRDGWKHPSVFGQESAAAGVALKSRQRGMERRAKRKNKEDPVTATEATKPNGGANDCLATNPSALNVSLMGRVLSPKNLQRAWGQVQANHGAPGVDGMTVEEFPDFVRSPQWAAVKKTLVDGTYRPQPVRRVYIPKASGGQRPLGIPTVLDRVIQQALAQVLEPLFDPEFSDRSYGFRKRRGAHDAVQQARAYLKEGYPIAWIWIWPSFFDSVNFDVLMQRVTRKVRDPLAVRLIWCYLRAGVRRTDSGVQRTRSSARRAAFAVAGQCRVARFGHWNWKACHKFVRYADDFLVLVKSERAGQR